MIHVLFNSQNYFALTFGLNCSLWEISYIFWVIYQEIPAEGGDSSDYRVYHYINGKEIFGSWMLSHRDQCQNIP